MEDSKSLFNIGPLRGVGLFVYCCTEVGREFLPTMKDVSQRQLRRLDQASKNHGLESMRSIYDDLMVSGFRPTTVVRSRERRSRLGSAF